MRLKTWFRIVGSLIIFLLVVTLATPFVVKSQVKKELVKLGAEQAEIESLYLNIWTGYVRIEGLNASGGDYPPLSLDKVETDILYLDLWKKRFHIADLSITGLNLHANIADQLHIGPLLIPTGSSDNTEEESTSEPWNWGITRLSLNDINLSSHFQDEDNELQISEGELQLLQNWQPSQSSHLLLRGALNNSAFDIDSRGTPLAADAGGDFKIKLDQLQLGQLLAPWVPDLEVTVQADIDVSISRNASDFQINQQGSLSLTDFSFKQEGLDVGTQSLNWTGKTETHLQGTQLQQISTDGAVAVAGIKLIQEQLSLQQGKVAWVGQNQLTFAEQLPSTINSTGKLTLQQTNLQQAELAVATSDISWEGNNQLTFDGAVPSKIVSDGKFGIAALALKQSGLDLATDSINWQGKNQLAFTDSIPSSIVTDGQLNIAALALKQDNLDLATKSINWQGTNELTMADTTVQSLVNTGVLSLSELALAQPELKLNNQKLSWDGRVSTDTRTQVVAEGKVNNQQLRLDLQGLEIASATTGWQGATEFNLTDAQLKSLAGNASIGGISLKDAKQTTLATVAEIVASNLAATKGTNQVAMDSLKITDIQLENQTPLLSLSDLQISKLITGPDETHMDSLKLGKLDTQLLLNTNGEPAAWNTWVAKISGGETGTKPAANNASSATAAANTKNASASPPYPFSLQLLELNQPAELKFLDESVDAQEISITLNKLHLTKIDTRSREPGDLAVAAKINRFGELNLDGNYAWMDPHPNGQWQGKLANLELPPFSPYMQRYSGYMLQSGQLNLDTGGTLKDGVVDSNNKLQMHNLRVRKASEEETREFDDQLGMPLQMALSMITDDDDNLELDIPVKGSLDDPQFGYQSVINIVMGKIVAEGAMGYLTASLQPYGAMISIGKFMMNNAAKGNIRLEPIVFAPGKQKLDDTASDYLEKITTMLKDKQSLRLNICGIAVDQDRQALVAQKLRVPVERLTPEQVEEADPKEIRRKLNELAERRSENVKQKLLEGEIAPERLFSCLPEVNFEDDQPPRVRMGL